MAQSGLGAAVTVGGTFSAIPVLALAALVGAGQVPAGAASIAGGAMLAGSVLLALVWPIGRLALTPAAATLQSQPADPGAGSPDQDASAERAILEALPDPLLLLTPDRSLRYANQAARRILGGEISAVLRHPTLRAAVDRVQGTGSTLDTVDLLLPVPVPRDLHATVIDLGAASAQGGTALLFVDRTQARAVERMRADFVANASHELRTPLASLIGFIDTLRGPAVDDAPAQQRFLLIMAEQAARMNRLIDDLLSLSRIELTEHLAPADRVDLAGLIARTLSSFEPRCTQAGATVRPSLEADIGPVLADADQLEQVIQNLLDNALKYGRTGGTISIALKSARGVPWPARPGAVVSVRDDGPGIPRADVPRLTERFYRVDRGRSRAAGGTGLGLAIVKHIVNRHRGQLAIESEEGAGSTFSVWLPL